MLEHVLYFNLTNAIVRNIYKICWWLFECSLPRNILHTSLPLPALTR
eukprot:COSAG01_NODE_318_length_18932_cov_26.063983_6_plen_47_part_00